jgi:HlyD family type I secretion membrane fusion protein
MAQLPSFIRRRPTDLISAPISAFESETQAVIQKTAPYSEHAILHVLAGMVVLIIFLMSVVKLDRVVTSSGQILPSHGSIFVQPLDRAIVTGLLVRSGDVVKKGQVLATLDPTFAQADLKDLQQKKASSEALVARLKAEQAGHAYVVDASSPFSLLQDSIWRQRQAEYQQSINDFDARIRAASSSIEKSQRDAEGYRQRLALASELEKSQLALQAKGYGSRVSVLSATDNRVEDERLMSQSQNDSSQGRHDLTALIAQRAVYIGKWRDDVSTQLVTAQNDLDTATQNAAKATKVSDLSTLVAPADAVVLKVGKASIGSVIDTTSSNNDPLFTLVPLEGALEAEVQIDAKDIGFIRPGDPVRIKLDAYKFTSHGTAKGVIKTISEGSFTQADNGQTRAPFFKVRVAFTDVHLRNVPTTFRLIPGMTMQGEVIVGRRTIMAYLLEGALRTGSEAMREA